MPLFYQQELNSETRIGVWQITEPESFFHGILPQYAVSHPHKRLQHLAGRHLLRSLYPSFPLELIRVADTRKPFLEDDAFHFSISHCGDFAAAIVSPRHRVGVDIELFTPRVARIQEKFLHADEQAWVRENGANELELLTLLWNCKEAVFKWWSYGKVDFSEQIRIEPLVMQQAGQVNAAFIDGERHIRLQLEYQVFTGFSLAWVVNDQR